MEHVGIGVEQFFTIGELVEKLFLGIADSSSVVGVPLGSGCRFLAGVDLAVVELVNYVVHLKILQSMVLMFDRCAPNLGRYLV